MPATKKRSYKKKPRSSTGWLTKYKPSSSAIHQPITGLGRSLRTKLKTSWYANVTPVGATGVFTGFVYPGSCFDPTGNITTHQPTLFDQLKLIYGRYLVTGATVEIEACRTQVGTLQETFVIAAYPSTVDTPVTKFEEAASRPYAQSKMGQPGAPAVKLFFRLNTQKIVGSRLPVIAEDCGALVTGNPAIGQNIVLPIFIQNANANNVQVTLKITIIQDVIFDQMINVVDA